jgi:hypothetical protein
MPTYPTTLQKLMTEFPTPKTPDVTPYRFSLDGGGRDMLQDYFREHDIKLVAELGCFLCGSVLQWLEAKPDLCVIGIDPWDGRWHEIIERYVGNKVFDPCFINIEDKDVFIASLREHGAYLSSMANIQEYRNRFIPIIGKSPEKLHFLKEYGVEPDFIYFDNDKGLSDLDVALDLWPDAHLGGDDWTWGKDQGLPVQKAVKEFCERHSFSFEAKRASWLIHKS